MATSSRVRGMLGAMPASWRSSARARILASYLLLLLFASTLGLVAVREIFLRQLDTRIESSLSEEITEFDRLVREGNPLTGESFGDDPRALFNTFLAIDPPPPDEQIVTMAGDRVYRVGGLAGTDHSLIEDAALVRRWNATTEPRLESVDTPAGPVRYRLEPVVVDGEVVGRFIAAAFVTEAKREIDNAIRTAAAVIVGLLALGSVFAFVAAGRVLAPLKRLTSTAQRITETDLTRRIEITSTDEVAEAGRTFNAMLDRLDQAFSSQRRLLRDIGHELRTPLAIASGHLEFIGDDPDERRETLELVQDEHRRMGRLIEDLLLLARAERPDFLRLETVDLAALGRELLAKATALGARDWRLEATFAGRVVADRQRLMQAMVNLIDNAVGHTQPGDTITIGARCEHGIAWLWVQDRGPGVKPEDQTRIFESFERGDGTQTAGTGLGLAIVRRIAKAHAGTATVDSRPGEGARFSIRFPMDPPDVEPEA